MPTVLWCSWEIEPGSCPDCSARLWIVWARGQAGDRRARWCPGCAPDLEGLGFDLAAACGPAAEFRVWHSAESLEADQLELLTFWAACLVELALARGRPRLRLVSL